MTDAKEPGFWTRHVGGRVATHGWGGAAKESLGEMKNAFTSAGEGNRMKGFGRIGGVGVGVAMAGDALFRGKTSDGEDRSGLARVGEAVLGTGIAVGSLVAGRGR